jgi:DNA-binding NtrC family response regulator
MGFRVRKISAPSRAAVLGHAWPGNVRELRQVLLAASVASGDSEVVEIGIVGWMPSEPASPAQSLSVPIAGLALRENVERGTVLVERHLIVRALAQNTTFAEAARALGIDQKTLNLKRHRYGIDAGAGEWDDED